MLYSIWVFWPGLLKGWKRLLIPKNKQNAHLGAQKLPIFQPAGALRAPAVLRTAASALEKKDASLEKKGASLEMHEHCKLDNS